jgi:glycosyltransferase involved in cell wall biosynthesis
MFKFRDWKLYEIEPDRSPGSLAFNFAAKSICSFGKQGFTVKIVFMHYHLKTGGVTTCLKNQVEALKSDCDVCVITGELPQTGFPAKTIHIPELAYSADYQRSFEPAKVAAAVVRSIESHFGGPCDIVHVHNPILAKNKNFLKILKALQKKGLTLLLQIHDFAEDGRPRSYFNEDYPQDCHYSVINSRDYQILLKSGLKKQGLHQIFNTVYLSHNPYPSIASDAGPYVVYPIRAIRRKNIGEAILLSLFFRDNETLVITLPPNSQADIESYKDWKAFVTNYQLRVEFERGLNYPYESILSSARYLLTTSITEGFGFSFLEPWLFNKSVWGRKLCDICKDFEVNGVCFDHMYTALNVPVDWIELVNFYEQWKDTIHSTAKLFDFAIDNDRIQSTFASLTDGGMIDFGLLNEEFQKQVLGRLLTQNAHAQLNELLSLNPFLAKIGRTTNEKDLIEKNRNAVARSYGMSQYRQKLLAIYAHVDKTIIRQQIDKKKLLAEFLDLTKFSLLKWGDYGAR